MSGNISYIKTENADKYHRPQDGEHKVKETKSDGPRAMTHAELTAAAEATGGIYFENRSVALNMLGCATLFFKKYDNGRNPDLIYTLGLAYANGYGVKKNLLKAIMHFTRAAKLGHSGAQTNFGLIYISGEGVERDLKQAKHYYELAAAQGEQSAIRALRIIKEKNELSELIKSFFKESTKIDNRFKKSTLNN
ncbi:MAG: sel1 repeat family protein [Alphaproteobacteria bacterium]|jgi:TPR repeat protein|nr:sel1 repeat family protein [Alphaproteobacteria bacterium]MBP9876982.1 sel1 repeat family protein [Alphaproteobacteria bacterium]